MLSYLVALSTSDDVSKAEENLRCQLAAFNEVKTLAEQIDRKENGTLLVKPLAQYIKKKSDIIESDHLRTLVVVVPKSNQKKFLESYELMEAEWQEEERKLGRISFPRSLFFCRHIFHFACVLQYNLYLFL